MRADTHDGPEQNRSTSRPNTLMQLSRSSLLELRLATRGRAIHTGTKRRFAAMQKRGGLDRAELPIELALDALDGADADMMLGGELADAGAALLQGVPDFALDGDWD